MATQLTTSRRNFASSNNTLGLKLYHLLRSENEGNIIFSPFGIATAIAMTYMGAGGNTAKQIEDTLSLPKPSELDESIHKEIKVHNANLIGRSDVYILKMANRLYSQKKFEFQPEFLNATRKFYNAMLEALDFAGHSEEARAAINGWVEEVTERRIQDLISPGVLTANTRLVLVNALYFKAEWVHQFKKTATSAHPFYLTESASINVPLMIQTHNFEFYHDKHHHCKILQMKFKQHKLEMMFMLPDSIEGLADLEANLSSEVIQGWYAEAKSAKVRVMLPKFKFTQNFSLAQNLSDIGMSDLFSASADLSGISEKDDLFVSDVVHKAFLEINEDGCEAAAVTAVVLSKKKGLKSQPEPKMFKADHPFLFLIHSIESGAIVFMGRVKHLENWWTMENKNNML